MSEVETDRAVEIVSSLNSLGYGPSTWLFTLSTVPVTLDCPFGWFLILSTIPLKVNNQISGLWHPCVYSSSTTWPIKSMVLITGPNSTYWASWPQQKIEGKNKFQTLYFFGSIWLSTVRPWNTISVEKSTVFILTLHPIALDLWGIFFRYI